MGSEVITVGRVLGDSPAEGLAEFVRALRRAVDETAKHNDNKKVVRFPEGGLSDQQTHAVVGFMERMLREARMVGAGFRMFVEDKAFVSSLADTRRGLEVINQQSVAPEAVSRLVGEVRSLDGACTATADRIGNPLLQQGRDPDWSRADLFFVRTVAHRLLQMLDV